MLTSPQNLLPQVETIARAAGDLALSFKHQNADITYKDGLQESPLTAADLAVDAYLHQHLTALNPTYGWLSEETTDDGNWQSTPRFWVVDPIDGTTGFVHYLQAADNAPLNPANHFAISIALIENGHPILGVVYTPLDNCMMAATHENKQTKERHATKRDKTTQNDTPTRQNTTLRYSKNLNDYTFLASTSEVKRHLLTCLPHHLTQQTMGSSANKIARTATQPGLITASVKPKCWWDVAAAACLCHANGITLTNLNGEPLVFTGKITEIDGIIAAPPAIHQTLKNLLPNTATAGYI